MNFSQNLFWSDSKKTLWFALPYTSARLLNAANWFVSMMIIARLGKDFVAAGVLMYSNVVMVQLIVWSMMYSVSVLVGRAYGAKEYKDVGKMLQSGFLLSLLIGIPAAIFLGRIDSLLLLLHQPASLVTLAQPYFQIMAFSLLPSLWYVSLYKFAIGIGKPRLVFISMAIAVPCNLFLTYALTLGKFGLPALGLVGVAYANLVMYLGLFLGLLSYFYFNKNFQGLHLFNFARASSFKYVAKLFTIGWPISIAWGAMMLTYTCATYMIGWVGKDALAAHQVVTQCVNLVIMIPYSVQHVTAVLVAQALGKGRRDYLEKIGYAGIFLSLVLVGIGSLFYWFTPHLLARAFLDVQASRNISIISLAATLFAVVGFSQLSDTVGSIATGALRGFHDTFKPMLISVMSNWLVSLPLAYILAFFFNLGARGVYFGCLVGSVISASFLLARWKKMCRGC